MSHSLRFDAGAERELNEAVDFYDLESPGLGDVFLADFNQERVDMKIGLDVAWLSSLLNKALKAHADEVRPVKLT